MMNDEQVAIVIAEAKARYASAWLAWLRLAEEHPELGIDSIEPAELRARSLFETLGFLKGVQEGLEAALDGRPVGFEPR